MKNETLTVTSSMSPPHWALLQRELIRSQSVAIEAFYDKYFDDRGYLLCVPRWGGNDGPDDAAENLLNWTVLHALGAPDIVLDLYKKGWEGHLVQYTEAKTVEVPMGRDGMYYKEFPVMFDWFHHGEWLSSFFLQGLSDPHDRTYEQRTRRYAALYMDEDPLAPNYDPEHRIIRSMFNGSRGPLLRKATALDWAGDPIEIEGRFKPGHGENTFEQMLQHFEEYNDIVGDHPLNLASTTLALNAYMLTREPKYKEWMLEYIDAWVERTEANGGIIPSNVGLDGTIGGECDGKWYGGVYGWGFSVTNPVTGEIAHRSAFVNRCCYAFANALLMTGDRRYIDLWRRMIDVVNENSKKIDGRTMYPHSYGDDGWYNYRPDRFLPGALEIYCWTMDPEDRERVPDSPWLAYLGGDNPGYPVSALERDVARLGDKVRRMSEDMSTPDTRMSDDMNEINPATTDALIQLMLGGIPTGRVGYPLHCRLRYFDPDKRRAGVPQDVAALVTEMTANSVAVTLVNLSPVFERDVVVQGGAYGEHQLSSADVGGTTLRIDGPHFAVRLAPGCGQKVRIDMKRYASEPAFSFPWD